MPQELLYTSAQTGLKPGSRGFCTVAATAGLAPQKLLLLESLSGYRHTQSPTGPAHPGNPIVFSHLILPSRESLLSRIADAGLDYSGRTNKIAHHILLDGNEQVVTGPASNLSASGCMISTWTGDPRMLAQRSLPAGSVPQGPCVAWKRITGDAGWAGVLAETAAGGNATDAYIIFESNIDCMSLIDEALSLLQPTDRWRVTFSTFFTSLPPNIPCQWKCVLKGSKEHQAIPPHNRVLKLDLTSSMGLAPDSPLVESARSGKRIAPEPTISKPTPVTLSAKRPLRQRDEEISLPASDEYLMQASPTRSNPSRPISQAPAAFNDLPPSYPPRHTGRQKDSKPSVLPYVVASLIAFVFGGAVVGGGIFLVLKPPQIADSNTIKAPSNDAKHDVTPVEDSSLKIADATSIEQKVAESESGKVDEANNASDIPSEVAGSEASSGQGTDAKKNVVDVQQVTSPTTPKSNESKPLTADSTAQPDQSNPRKENNAERIPTRIMFFNSENPSLPTTSKLENAEFWKFDSGQKKFNVIEKLQIKVNSKGESVLKNNGPPVPPTPLFSCNKTNKETSLKLEETFQKQIEDSFLYLKFENEQSYLLTEVKDSQTLYKISLTGKETIPLKPLDYSFFENAKLRVEPEAKWERVLVPPEEADFKTSLLIKGRTESTVEPADEPTDDNKQKNILLDKNVTYTKQIIDFKMNRSQQEKAPSDELLLITTKNDPTQKRPLKDVIKLKTQLQLIQDHKDKKINVFIDGIEMKGPDDSHLKLRLQFNFILDSDLREVSKPKN